MAELSSQSVCSAGRNTTLTEIIKSLAIQRLMKLEEQCIHDFKLIKYDYVKIMDH